VTTTSSSSTSGGAAGRRSRRVADPEALHQQAIAENARGRPAAGAAACRRALRALGVNPDDEPRDLVLDPPSRDGADGASPLRTVARVLATLARSEVETRSIDAGLRRMALASRWATREGSDDLLGYVHSQRALLLFRGGRFAAAVDEFAAAEEHVAAGIDRCRLLINRGALHVEMGQLGLARTDLEAAVALSRDLGDRAGERIALHNLGCLEFFAGDLPLALRIIDEGIAMDEHTQLGIALLDRSRVLLAAGLYDEADESLATAARQLSRDRAWQDVGEVELTRAEVALLSGQAADARRLAGRARDRFRRHGNARWRRSSELVLLQADLRAGRPPSRLVRPALRLADEFAADGFETQSRTATLLAAELQQRLGRSEDAAALARRAGQPRAADPIASRLHTRYVHALLDVENGRWGAAHRQLRSGLDELAAYQAQFGSIDLQTASAVHGTRLVELDVDLALVERIPLSVLAAVERGRAVSRRIRPVRPPDDPEVAALLAELRRVVEGQRHDPSVRAATAGGGREVRELQRQLRARAWHAASAGRAVGSVAPPRLRAELDRVDSAFVCYVETHGQLYAVVLDQRARLVFLGSAATAAAMLARVRADVELAWAGHLPAGIAATVRGSLTHTLQRLDDLLVAPLHLSDRRLVVVPSASLVTLPWGLLPSGRGRPVAVSPSATAWVAAARPSRARRRPRVEVYAGPGLRLAPTEAQTVGKLWPRARVRLGEEAGPAALRHSLAVADIVHVAAHGVHEPQSPLFSSLRLSGGPVFAYELDQAAGMAPHVVLSACELGQATVRPGDESLGLTSVLLALGTRSVVAGVARIPDDVCAEVMVRYHRSLARGVDSAQAIQDAGEVDGLAAPFVCFGAAWALPGAGAEG
jgi:tetratricopeptide (TPR) repeat protein